MIKTAASSSGKGVANPLLEGLLAGTLAAALEPTLDLSDTDFVSGFFGFHCDSESGRGARLNPFSEDRSSEGFHTKRGRLVEGCSGHLNGMLHAVDITEGDDACTRVRHLEIIAKKRRRKHDRHHRPKRGSPGRIFNVLKIFSDVLG
ncbi:MAG: hypothetical protein O7D29_03505 [Gemmatimonadetes bacterium]|nr:hypothetical protein [Gemmatimonadota bacterium]